MSMPASILSAPYAEQIEADAIRLRAATGLSHAEYIVALTLLVIGQMKEAEFLLADHGLPIPWPAQPAH